MTKPYADKFIADPQYGLTMLFFNAPEIQQLDFPAIAAAIPNAECDEFHCIEGDQEFIKLNNRVLLGRMICEDGQTVIHSNYRPIELSIAVKNICADQRALLKNALKHHLPEPSALHEEWLKAKYRITHDLTDSVLQDIPRSLNVTTATFTNNEAFSILQGEYGITKADSKRPVLASQGASYCAILSLYNRAARQGFLSHIDDVSNLDDVSAQLFALRPDPARPIEAAIAGGTSETYEMIADIVLRLKEQQNINFLGWEEWEHMPLSLALDARTGNLSTLFNAEQLDPGPLFTERNARIFASFSDRSKRPLLCIHNLTHGRDTALRY